MGRVIADGLSEKAISELPVSGGSISFPESISESDFIEVFALTEVSESDILDWKEVDLSGQIPSGVSAVFIDVFSSVEAPLDSVFDSGVAIRELGDTEENPQTARGGFVPFSLTAADSTDGLWISNQQRVVPVSSDGKIEVAIGADPQLASVSDWQFIVVAVKVSAWVG